MRENRVKKDKNLFDIETNNLILSSGATLHDTTITRYVLRLENTIAAANKNSPLAVLKLENLFPAYKEVEIENTRYPEQNKKVLHRSDMVVQYRQQVNVVFQLFANYQRDYNIHTDLEELLGCPTTQVPFGLATADGVFAKSTEIRSADYVNSNATNEALPPLKEIMVIYGDNATFYWLQKVA